MPDEKQIHQELAAFGPDIIAYLESMGFWDIEGPYDHVEVLSSAPASAKREYLTESKKKNSLVWQIAGVLFAGAGIASGMAQIKADYPRQIAKFRAVTPKRPTAQDYQNQYIRERGGEFVTQMTRTDQQRLTNFLWRNAGVNERPLAKRILRENPQLAYLVDNKEYRLKAIKRTEVGRATGYGSMNFAKDNGAKEKTRHAAGDKRTRPSHAAISGQTRPIDKPYSNGEMFCKELSVNCRCHDTFSF
jgi:hypothetical protein